MRKLILRNFQSAGDIVMLTAAVRDLHRSYPGEFVTDVRTPFPELWAHNPHIRPLHEEDPAVTAIDCHYPLIDQSDTTPCHFLHGFPAYLNDRLGLRIRVSDFKGDIHLSDEERTSISGLASGASQTEPYWLLVSGGKRDYTIKWWDPSAISGSSIILRDEFSSCRWGSRRIIIPLYGTCLIYAGKRVCASWCV